MENTDTTTTSPSGGIAVRYDPDSPGDSSLEILVALDDVLIYPADDPGASTMVGLKFDYASGSVCGLLAAVRTAHDHLVGLLGAGHN